MNREEIKEQQLQAEEFREWFSGEWNRNKGTVDDLIDHNKKLSESLDLLFSRIEIADKMLEEAKEKTALAVNKMCGGNVERHVFEDTRAAYYAIDKALQQIRS